MAVKLKPLNEQVIVITGASSGIGLATATQALKQGASVVMASRGIAQFEQFRDDFKVDLLDPTLCRLTLREKIEVEGIQV